MGRYVCHGVTLEVVQEGLDEALTLARFLRGLWWTRSTEDGSAPHLHLRIRPHPGGPSVPCTARRVWEVDGFQGYELAEDLYISDGRSVLHVQPQHGEGQAQLAPDFFAKPQHAQQTFWMLGLLKLLRALGRHIVHAAGVVSRANCGLLLIRPSGSGKSTLSLSLIRQGWCYLSDDSLLLRRQADDVLALTWRKTFAVEVSTAGAYADLTVGEARANAQGRHKQSVCLEAAYPGQQVAGCVPRALLFPRVRPQAQSTVLPLDHASALRQLLTQSGPPLFDRRSMAQHLAVCTRLLQQAPPYAFDAGSDVFQAPDRVARLLTTILGEA